MSKQYPGGIISKTPPVPSGPYADSTAPGIWTLEQQAAYAKQGQWPTAGNVNPNAFIENLFSTYLYTGTGASTFPVPNGIDLAGKGGLVWFKERSGTFGHILTDSVRGIDKYLASQTTAAQITNANYITAFNSDGYTAGVNENEAGKTFVSWTFRKQPKFFDVVTYTGNGTAGHQISHSLGSVPGMVIVKGTTTTYDWYVWHRSLTAGENIKLNSTAAASSGIEIITGTSSTTFTVNQYGGGNQAGESYVAYVFAHDAGGFGLTGTDNVISCGSYTGSNSSAVSVNLGYEPQWVMIKRTDSSGSPAWWIGDTMRGLNMQGINRLEAWTSNAESAAYNGINPTATGFVLPYGTVLNDAATSNYIYIAIRRGPMAVPTVGTSVYNAIARTGTGATANVTGVGFPVDLNWSHIRDAAYPNVMDDRLRGSSNTLKPSTTDGEGPSSTVTSFASMDGVQYGTSDRTNASGNTYINWYFRRAPGFFDEVCYTGTGSATTFTHNLGVVPEMMIVKGRSVNANWAIYTATTGATKSLFFTDSAAGTYSVVWNDTAPTSSVFTVGTAGTTNSSGGTYVAYLFATVAGVSKVGSYTGTGALQTVNCGLTSGARFVLIKRTDSTGDWYMYDSVRGITSGNDPYLFANVDAVEVTGTNYVDTDTTGFKVTAAAPAGLNANGGTYIFLAIA
jgi:hypothetical protein